MKQFKVIIEKHTDGYIGYPLGLKGVVVGQGDTYDEALADVKSAIRAHIETFWIRRNSNPLYPVHQCGCLARRPKPHYPLADDMRLSHRLHIHHDNVE